jgi:hypothetical protein
VNRTLKRVLIGVGALIGVVVLGGAAFAGFQAYRFDASLDRVYPVPVPEVERSTDPAVIARGQHLMESIGGCTAGDCHGSDLGGGKTLELGPLGRITGPNISAGGLGVVYTDGELFRIIRHGLKKDGRSLSFMPSHEIYWLSDSDITALISYFRTLPPSSKPNGPVQLNLLAKVLDRLDLLVLDVARRIDHEHPELAPPPSPDANYGRFVAKLCTGCHGSNLAGGPIPGAPPELPTPLNLTPDATGLQGWSYADFDRALTEGKSKNGRALDPFMPRLKFDETEKKALWAHLSKLPARPLGDR